ncbi:uncharacterized protein LOC109715962 [Ananas comosus]|uniref:Uncharacterized protein LOC109715962 n=1 Tax=Ananas comosus TaxID=4615 RepID=A0A6P5FUP0_ANACO|nr:uncharacterized protein LOC109715962 [Ananas comosus]
MGNSFPCMAHGATPNVSKEKLHGCTVFFNQLHKLKQKPRAKAHRVAKETNNGSNMALSKDQHMNDGGGGGHEKGIIRVKVVLTKKEAAQLLSMCVHGEKDVSRIASELKRSMEMSRLASGVPRRMGWRPALASIPEEWE